MQKNALALLTSIMNNAEGGAALVDPLPTVRIIASLFCSSWSRRL